MMHVCKCGCKCDKIWQEDEGIVDDGSGESWFGEVRLRLWWGP